MIIYIFFIFQYILSLYRTVGEVNLSAVPLNLSEPWHSAVRTLCVPYAFALWSTYPVLVSYLPCFVLYPPAEAGFLCSAHLSSSQLLRVSLRTETRLPAFRQGLKHKQTLTATLDSTGHVGRAWGRCEIPVWKLSVVLIRVTTMIMVLVTIMHWTHSDNKPVAEQGRSRDRNQNKVTWS